MAAATRRCRTPRRVISVLGTLGLIGGMLAVLALPASASPGGQQWTDRFNAQSSGVDLAWAIAVSSTKVFVTGASTGTTSGSDYLTVAYKAATGATLWTKRYDGPGNAFDQAASIAVNPNGTKVFVTGKSKGTTSGEDYATIAYSATTGAALWTKRYDGPGNGPDGATSIVVRSGMVFVTGSSKGTTSGEDYATIAYSASTGATLWKKRYDGPGNAFDTAASIAVNPSGTSVFVTGASTGTTSGFDYATLAYDASTGSPLWTMRYDGPGNASDQAASIAVNPNGTSVFVTGESDGTTSGFDYATIAYDASTGSPLWTMRYDGPGNVNDGAWSIAVNPSGTSVFVTGASTGTTSDLDYATIAYDASTGSPLWTPATRLYNNSQWNGPDVAGSIAVSPDGTKLFVTGVSQSPYLADYLTVAYDASTGALDWKKRYNGPGDGDDVARSIAVSPNGTSVFVTGASFGSTATGDDYFTIAYEP